MNKLFASTPHISEAARFGFLSLASASFAFGFTMAGQQNVVSNFFEHLGLDGPQFGYITAIREIPGFLLIFLTALFYRLSLPNLTALAMVLLAIGMAFFGTATSFWSVTPWVIISSMGYHTWLQTQSALGMSLTTERTSGVMLGKIAAIQQAGGLVAMAFVLIAFQQDWIDYRAMYMICAAFALFAALAISRVPNLHDGVKQERHVARERIVLRKDYKLFYMLSVLDGARQQIFFSFGLWVLVDHFSLGVSAISAVMLATSALAMFTGPMIGRQIDIRGEKDVLASVNILYIIALLGYALVDNVIIVIACYVLFNFIFPLSAMGANIYLRKIAPPRDIAPSLAMGVTMQHFAAISVPLATGFVLNYVGYQIAFLVAAAFASLTILVTRKLDPANQKSRERLEDDARRQTILS